LIQLLFLLENLNFVVDFSSVPDSSDELAAHDQTGFLVDDVFSQFVDRNHGALVRSAFHRSEKLDPESEFLHFLRRSNAEDPAVEVTVLIRAKLEKECFVPEKMRSHMKESRPI
jgi:hypothetical protein